MSRSELVHVECACPVCDHTVEANRYDAIVFCDLCGECNALEAPCTEDRETRLAWGDRCPECSDFKCGHLCECGEHIVTAEPRWEPETGRVWVFKSCGECRDRRRRVRRLDTTMRQAGFLRDELAEETDPFIAECVAAHGREIARASGKPGDYPKHIETRLRLERVPA